MYGEGRGGRPKRLRQERSSSPKCPKKNAPAHLSVPAAIAAALIPRALLRRPNPAFRSAAAAIAIALLATVVALGPLAHGRAHREILEDRIATSAVYSRPISDQFHEDGGRQFPDALEIADTDSADPAPAPITIRFTLDRSVRASRILQEAGLATIEADRWAGFFENVAHTRILSDGHVLSLFKDPQSGDLRGFAYDLNDHSTVVEQDYGAGVILTRQRPIQYIVRPVSVAFAIRDNFGREITRRGIPKPIVESLEDAFSDHPLEGLPPGSGLKLIYNEQVSRDGSHRMPKDLEAAQLKVGGRTLRAYAFRDEHGLEHLYDDHGKPLGPQVLRFPLPFEYISSGFSTARYHPILHRYRPHVGIDLVAQYGTPVKAIADGRVESSEWAGELGNCVRLAHDRDMVSIYGHLSRISPDAKPGSYVKVGQVIGWVGSTGLSTGPHLHFAILHEGRYVNPLNEKLGENHEVSPRLRGFFEQIKQHYQALLAKLPDLGSHQVLASDRKPAISRFGDLYHVELTPRVQAQSRRARIRHRIPRGTRTVSLSGSSVGGL